MTTKIDPRVKAGALVEAGIRPGTAQAKRFGEILAQVREGRGEKRVETARKLGVSATVLSTWERGAGVPGESSYRKIRRWLGTDAAKTLDGWLAVQVPPASRIAKAGKATEAQARKVARGAKVTQAQARAEMGYAPIAPEPVPVPVPVPDAGEDRLLAAVLASGLGDRQKALLCAAVVAMVAGVDVQVEVSARV